jgi:uncharacterized RDD family membrane protein YckC
MNNKQTPLRISGIHESLYAGFWTRLGSLLADFVFLSPVVIITLFINGLGKNVYFYTLIPSIAFGIWYNIYLPKRYGGTPGKMVSGIKIIRLDGEDIGWKEAFLRHIVLLALTIVSSIMMIICLLQADVETFSSLGWLKRTQYLMTFAPGFYLFYSWANNIWVYSEFIVLLTNRRKRAIHDYIAGTVIIKEKYHKAIRKAMLQADHIADDSSNLTGIVNPAGDVLTNINNSLISN